MHANEIDITAGLVTRLIAAQFPQWTDLPVSPVASSGTVHALFRLGDELLIRLPRVLGNRAHEEQEVLPRLAPFLPVAIPSLIGRGRPVDEYPWPWSVLSWLDGENPVEDQVAAPDLLAADLADFVAAFWKIDLPDGPPAYPSGPLSALTKQTLTAIGQLEGVIETGAARAIWTDALRLPAWEGADTWVHADLMPGNLLTRDGRLAAVIDFESAGVGDPACDLIVAWMLLPAQVRPAFRHATGADDATWLRGRARALSMALGHIPHYKDTNPAMVANACYTVREVFADYHGSVSEADDAAPG